MTTLYEEIGGKNHIELLVAAFYQRVLNDPLLKPFFKNTSIKKLKRMQIAFFTIALDGPPPDTKISLYAAHQGRGITIKHLTRFTEHLLGTLLEYGFDENKAHRIYERIATYADDILGESSVDG